MPPDLTLVNQNRYPVGMLIFRGGYRVSSHYYRNTCVVRERDDEIFNQGDIVGRKWWAPFAPLMDYAVIVWKARFNPFRIFGLPKIIHFSYADFFEYRSRMGEVIYRGLLHFKKQHDEGNAMAICDYMEGLEAAIWSFWFVSSCPNPEGKYFSDVYGHRYEYSEEAQAKYREGMKWFAENFATLWD